MKMDRRKAMAGGLALASIASSPGAWAHPHIRARSDLSALQKFVRIRSSEAGRKTFWWYTGQVLARVGDTPLRPILTQVGASQTIGEWLEDGSFLYRMTEAGYYDDLKTGGIADAPITNPLTGEPMTVQHYLSSQTIIFTPDLKVQPETPLPDSAGVFEGTITAPDEKGDRIWMAERLLAMLHGTPTRSRRVVNSLANFEASRADVESSAGFVPATMQYTTMNSFRPWMNMGDRPGHISSRLNGLKLDRWSGVEAGLRARVENDHPGVFSDV